jgi:hypothetical protein
MSRQLIDARVPIDLTSKSKSKSFSKISDLNKKPAIGFGYIYIIEHLAQGEKGVIRNGYYVGLTTQTVNERWQQHLLAAKSLK